MEEVLLAALLTAATIATTQGIKEITKDILRDRRKR